jgi:hypothetical protein
VIPEVIHFPQGFTDQFQRCQMGNWGYGHHVFEKRPYVCERCASIGTPKEMEQWISPAKSSKPYIYVYLFIYNIYIYTQIFLGITICCSWVSGQTLAESSATQSSDGGFAAPKFWCGGRSGRGAAADRWNPVQRMDKIWENHQLRQFKTIAIQREDFPCGNFTFRWLLTAPGS